MKTGALILASGRTGHTDAMEPMQKVGGISAVHRLIRTFWRAGVDEVVLVTEAETGGLERHVARMGVITLHCESTRPEMLDCAKVGLAYLRGKCEAVLLTPVDIPLFSVETVRLLASSGARLANPVCGGKRGHPLLMGAEYIPSILAYDGGDGVRGAIRSMGVERELVEVNDDGVLTDVGTDIDYDRLLRRQKQQGLALELRLRIVREEPFLGPGAVQLLRLIENTGSVRLACGQMGISYSKAWKMLGQMEHQFGEAVVERQQGGAYGGGAVVTATGRALMESYRRLERDCRESADKLFRRHFAKWL